MVGYPSSYTITHETTQVMFVARNGCPLKPGPRVYTKSTQFSIDPPF